MGSKEYIHIIAEKLGTAILKFDGPIYDDYCRLVHEGHTYRITSSLSVEKACNGLLYSDEDSMKLEMMLKSKEWDGNGLPPVGCECEYETKFDGWQPVRIELIKSEGIAFTWLSNSQAYNGLDCVGVQKSGSFRPVRSEADKKRDEAIESIKAMLMYDYGDDPRLNDAVILYDAIAAGKIPHIRID